MCALLHANLIIPSEVNGVCIWAVNHVLVCAQKQKFYTRPTHCVATKQIVHSLAQSDGEPAGVPRTRFPRATSQCVRGAPSYVQFHSSIECTQMWIQNVY